MATTANGLLAAVAGEGQKYLVGDEKKEGGGKKEKDGKKESSEKLEPKDFFWDQFIKYLSSAILSLTVINVILQFFRDGGVSCFHPPDTLDLLPPPLGIESLRIYGFARDQASFLNSYCIGSIPLTEYFPIFILAHGLLLVAPHFIWSAIYKGDFDSFFSIAGKIDRLRDGKTGEYSKDNFDRVQKLGVEYGGNNRRIFASYVGKLCLQLMVCGVSIGLSAGWLRDFSFSFRCPRELAEEGKVPDEWPLNTTVPCVYTTLRILSVVRIADFILTAIAAVLIMYGLLWCVVRHTEQLGHVRMAKFAFQSGLQSDLFVFPPILQMKGQKHFGTIKQSFDTNWCVWCVLWMCSRRRFRIQLRNCVSPGISNDLDFLLLCLFRADASHGKVFKNIQVDKELKRLLGLDHQRLNLYINIQQDMYRDGIRPTLSDISRREHDDRSAKARKRNYTQDMLQAMRSITERLPCCLHCLVRCFGRCFSRKGRKMMPVTTSTTTTTTTAAHGPADEHLESFQDLFWQAGINVKNPEMFAYFFFQEHLGNLTFNEDDLRGVRDVIFLFISKYGRKKEVAGQPGRDNQQQRFSNDLAMEISFGSSGYGLVVARAFRKAYGINFHPFFRNVDNTFESNEFHTNLTSFLYPDDVYTYNTSRLTDATSAIMKSLAKDRGSRKHTLDMLVVGPVSDEQHLITINLLLNSMYGAGYIGQRALLLAIRPLRIGSKKISCHKFEPSQQLFDVIQDDATHQGIKYRHVDGVKCIKVVCTGVSCRFEFVAYRFKGADHYQPPVPIVAGPPWALPHTKLMLDQYTQTPLSNGLETRSSTVQSSPSRDKNTQTLIHQRSNRNAHSMNISSPQRTDFTSQTTADDHSARDQRDISSAPPAIKSSEGKGRKMVMNSSAVTQVQI